MSTGSLCVHGIVHATEATSSDAVVSFQETAADRASSKGILRVMVPRVMMGSLGPRLVTMTDTTDVSSGVSRLDFDRNCSTYVLPFAGACDSIVADEHYARFDGLRPGGQGIDDPGEDTLDGSPATRLGRKSFN